MTHATEPDHVQVAIVQSMRFESFPESSTVGLPRDQSSDLDGLCLQTPWR
jgi:hypothetical protein